MVIWEAFDTGAGWSRWCLTKREAIRFIRDRCDDPLRRTGGDGEHTWFASEDGEEFGVTRCDIARGRAGICAFLNEREE